MNNLELQFATGGQGLAAASLSSIGVHFRAHRMDR
jgi:hypothetical protein